MAWSLLCLGRMNASLASFRPETAPIGGVPIPASTAGASAITAPAATADGIGFHDLLDVINPLQHIPVVSTIYRAVTGDTITPAARIAGDALYGGMIGLASSVVDMVIQTTTGKDIGDHVLATIMGDDGPTPPTTPSTALADAAPTAPQPPVQVADAGNTQSDARPSPLYLQLQQGMRSTHAAVPLNASVPVLEVHPGERASANQGLIQAETTQQQQAAPASTSTPAPTAQPDNAPINLAAPPAPMATNTASPPTDAIPQLMMQALDKYRLMAQQQNQNNKIAPPPVNTLN